MPKKSAEPITSVYQLKITLHGSKPPIWRRVLVPGGYTLPRLHDVIQGAMGWSDYHLHQFIVDGVYYGIPDPEYYEPIVNESRVKLQTVAPTEKMKFRYEYDFGDNWQHDILVEKILPPDSAITYPVCTAGKRACPPEDVGGMMGYAWFLDVIADPEYEEHETYLEWIGGEFDAEAFDIDEVNLRLKGIK